MSGRSDEVGRDLVPEAWRPFDDTLADEPSPQAVPDEAKAWLGDQRLMHGLLRALHTADAAARESRIAVVLERIDREAAAAPVRRWLWVAAAALLLALAGAWFALPDRLPTAEAAVGRAVAELGRDVNRRFRLEMVAASADGKQRMQNEFSLVTRPGMRFRIEGKLAFGQLQFGELRIGADGQELWILPANGAFRRSVPLAEKERLLQGLGDVLDLGYLDVHDLVRKLPADFDLEVVGRQTAADGRGLLRSEATRRKTTGKVHLRSAWLLCDEESGMVTRLEAEAETGRGFSRRLCLEYLGEEPAGLVDYKRPW